MLAMTQPLASAYPVLAPDFFARARQHMVESQLRPNGVRDEPLLEAFARLPREWFVATGQESLAYSDGQVAAGNGRFLLPPMVLGQMVQATAPLRADRVLCIGAATGYGAALLHEVAGEVVALESDATLLRQLQQNKRRLGLENLTMAQGVLAEGYAQTSPYKVILIEGGIQVLPEKIAAQLADGGRLVAIRHGENAGYASMGQLCLYENHGGTLSQRVLGDAAAPVLNGFKTTPRFAFA